MLPCCDLVQRGGGVLPVPAARLCGQQYLLRPLVAHWVYFTLLQGSQQFKHTCCCDYIPPKSAGGLPTTEGAQ